LPKGDNIHLYTVSISRTAVLSNRIQEFGKAARPGKGEVTKIASTYVGNERKNNRKNIGYNSFCYNKYI